MGRKLKVHYYKSPGGWGCPMADGHIQQSDTDSTDDWSKVTCRKCLQLRRYGYSERQMKKYKGKNGRQWTEN